MNPLTVEQLVDLTGRIMPSAQARELEHLGVAFCRRRDGSILVLEEAVRSRLTHAVADATLPTWTPDFGALSRRSR